MRQIVQIAVDAVEPDRGRLFGIMGLPVGTDSAPRLGSLLDDAVDLFGQLAQPRGLFEPVTREELDAVYPGEGRNAPASPLPEIYPHATGLALFAATLGNHVSDGIDGLFRKNDLALAYVLDAVASDAADTLAVVLGERFAATIEGPAEVGDTKVLAYSPGYCGWDVSGQGRLFGRLAPAEIGISLNGSYLMEPLKSVSGVLVAGPGRIHKFRPAYPFCEACRTHPCRARMASVLRPGAVRA